MKIALSVSAVVVYLLAAPAELVRIGPAKPRARAEATVERHPSPDRRSTLCLAAATTAADFPAAQVFVLRGTTRYDLGESSGLRGVKWSADSRTVTFETSEVLAYGTATVYRVTYRVGATVVARTLLRKETVEASG